MSRRLLAGLGLVLLCALPSPYGRAAHHQQMVLVSLSQHPVSPLDSIQLRSLYLGMRVSQGDRVMVPLRNLSDPSLDALFVQSVMAMTARSYERRLVFGKFREARSIPSPVRDREQLIQALKARPEAVTYMWADEARRIPGLQIIQVLWEGTLTD